MLISVVAVIDSHCVLKWMENNGCRWEVRKHLSHPCQLSNVQVNVHKILACKCCHRTEHPVEVQGSVLCLSLCWGAIDHLCVGEPLTQVFPIHRVYELHTCLCFSAGIHCLTQPTVQHKRPLLEFLQQSWITCSGNYRPSQYGIFNGHLIFSISELFWQMIPCVQSMADWFWEKESS